MTGVVRALSIVAVTCVLSLTGSTGSTYATEPETSPEKAISVPQTPEQHLAMASEYEAKAKAARQEAELHRKMFADFEKKELPALRSKLGVEPPWVAKMRKHCDAFIRDSEAIAKDADDFAKFHRMRAEEVRGK